ncbi:homeobox protein abdominal-B-like isoform X1 [Phlebotomus argentipes]|uniref:homeobox protein abdominal-B-like isoform X1 n=1 Tax=Phlebotomus argentipes TaxID=94469 RepID=UPI0028930902|nr:homeobox protein abdominal-B-like isoform X1 [Phlebotomus argentipes]XP_059612148.1 homeobox protein abdominal-B-like isoform X1 [Phlebotomus argentipes]XP_059612149.1 homeobox protein abdominal-B-like isoform X1 [Phlebotomus argentipes]XP_059612150.1 homeobox protein abdominal-B-like isoform X1 [Phlebotomus argentipes]
MYISDFKASSNDNYFGAYKVGSTIIIPKLFNRTHANLASAAYGSHATAGAWWGQHTHTHASGAAMYEDTAGQAGGHSPPTAIQQQSSQQANHVVQQPPNQPNTGGVQQSNAVAGQTQIVAPSTASESPASVSSQPAGPLHIPAKRPGFEPDPSVIRHPHAWGYETGFESQYHSHSQYYLERDRKSVYYGYPEAQFPQPPYWNYRDQPSYLTDDRHAARQTVEGTGTQSTYDTTYAASGLRPYTSDAYSTPGESPGSSLTAAVGVGTVGSCTPSNALEWTGQVTVRKKRKPYSKFQTLELEKEFLFNAYVSKQKRWELARNLNLTERQVKIWFQNRRMKNKKNSQRQAAQQNNNNSSSSNHNHGQVPPQPHHNPHHINLGLGMTHHGPKMHQ